MGLWARLRGSSPAPAPVALHADRPAARFSTLGWEAFPWWADQADGLGRVTREYALAVPSVLRARDILCGTLAALPLAVVDADNRPLPSWLGQVDGDVANAVTVSSTVEDLLFESVAWWRVTARYADGYPASARRIDPSVVTTQAPAGAVLGELPSGYVPGSAVWIGGEPVANRDIIRFDSPRQPLSVVGARAIRRAYKLAAAAEAYASSPQMRGYFTAVEGVDPPDKDVTDLMDAWTAARQANTDGYVPSGFQWTQAQVPTAVDLQLAQLIEKSAVEIANLFGVDPEDLGVSTTSRTYQNAVDRRQDKINETFGPLVAAITGRLSMPDCTKRGQRVVADWTTYLEPNPTDQATVDTAYLGAKAVTVDEVRKVRGLPPLTPAQKRELTPPAPQPVAPQGEGLATVTPINAHGRVAAAFSSDAGLVFDTDTVAETFAVDEQRRTITGLVVPWGEIGRSGGKRWRFAPDSLKFSKAHANRIKLLVDHDNSQSVGRLERTWSDGTGQWATFKVARGPEGDRALAMAADGARDGLSVGVGYEGDDAGFTYSDDTEPGVRYVTAAPWRETSLVALPAFAGARISAVTMAADTEGPIMPESQTPAAATEAAVTFSADQFSALMARLTAEPEPQQPAVINPTAIPVPGAVVNDAPLYRFDGNKGARCFTSDIATGAFADPELRGKAEKFIAEQMEAAFANISVANVAALNPAHQRPDLYVGSLNLSTRPIGSTFQGGVVNSLTTSVLPKFSASSGLAGAHTPGTEPTDGAFSTTTQTVTPAGISGRVTVNREVIDQGGSPQADQLIWREMVEYYMKTLEVRAVNALEALSLSDIPIVGVDADLQAALLAEFAGLQYIAGGDRYRGLALHQDLYTAIIGAVDADGRALFPLIGPTNAQGTVASDLSGVRVAGKVGVPAWALASGNGGPDKSFLYVPESCYQWFSAPRRIDLDSIAVATVGIGIWGYSAEFVSRNADVRQYAYTTS